MTAPVRLVPEPLDGPGGSLLVPAVQQEYVVRYGGPDEAAIDPAEFLPPGGMFLVAYDGNEPVACGGLRTIAPGIAELKRMYVVPHWRGRGLARRILAELEASAAAAGASEVRMETGLAQPEAIALYTSSGYERIPGYGHYADSENNVCFAKPLRRAACA